jgi:RsiW-degrading membrane proteinase PrsW (M82 family)
MTTQTREGQPTHTWRYVLAWGFVLWVVATVALAVTEDEILLPSVVLIGSFLVPVTTIFWFLDHDRATELDTRRLLTAFFVAGVLGMICSAALEVWLVPHRLLPNLWVGLIEEGAKGVGIFFMSRGLAHFDVRDGILLGTVVGLGFGAFESAGYTLTYGLHDGELSLHRLISEEVLRELIAPFCHGIWSGLLGAAIFAARRRFAWRVVLTYLGVVALHAIWDSSSNAAVILTVLISGPAELRTSLSPGSLPFPGDVEPQWLFGVLQWTLQIVVAIIGVTLVRRVWRDRTAVAA